MKPSPQLTAFVAALLFGASAPLAKLLLAGMKPVQLAGILYLGSGTGVLLIKILRSFPAKKHSSEAPLGRHEIGWLAGAIICGGIAAPIALMTGLAKTPASTASLLLNFEAVSTSVIALIFFKEPIGRRLWIAIVLITCAGIILSLDPAGKWGLSAGSLGIILACVLWGFDNNFTRNISLKDPYIIVIVKGFVSGIFSVVLSILLKYSFPDITIVVYGFIVGFTCYGISLVLFILALRNLGSSRTAAFFGLAPFLGTAISLMLFREFDNIRFYISLPFMLTGAWFLYSAKHGHLHRHDGSVHEHSHRHDDMHHEHRHEKDELPPDGSHTHMHTHDKVEHAHEHFPDIHHRHDHN